MISCALACFVIQHDLQYAAQARDIFYPVHYSQPDILFSPEEDVNLHLSEETRAIHLWNELIKKNKPGILPMAAIWTRSVTSMEYSPWIEHDWI